MSLEGESCRPEDSLHPAAAAASSCCRLPTAAGLAGGELADVAVVSVGAAEVATATDEGGGGGEASGSAAANGFA